MLLDIIYAVLIVLAIIKGWQKGLIVGLFSLVAIVIGLAAAIKLSAVVANYIGRNVKISEQWLPVISFAVVFLVVVILVRLGAKIIQKFAESIMLGLFNRIGGVLLYAAIYTIVFSVILFYTEQLRLIKPGTKEKSVSYEFVQPWGPKAINAMGAVIPIFRNMFDDLQEFFGKVSQKVPEK
jgi:membrane protein required for colicin V production